MKNKQKYLAVFAAAGIILNSIQILHSTAAEQYLYGDLNSHGVFQCTERQNPLAE